VSFEAEERLGSEPLAVTLDGSLAPPSRMGRWAMGGGLSWSVMTSSFSGPLMEPPSISTGPCQAVPSCDPLHAPSSQR
jgi:hypothetical protein